MPGGEADQVGEPLDHHRVAVADQRRDGVAHGGDLAAAAQSSSPSSPSMIARAVSTSCSSTTSGGASRSVLFPAPSSSSPRWKAPLDEVVEQLGRGLPRAAILHELDPDHQADAAHVADAGMLRLELPEAGHEPVAHP